MGSGLGATGPRQQRHLCLCGCNGTKTVAPPVGGKYKLLVFLSRNKTTICFVNYKVFFGDLNYGKYGKYGSQCIDRMIIIEGTSAH
jgi:hypothetical protein